MDKEAPLHSASKLNEYKEREFREYLVDQGMTLAIVKCKTIAQFNQQVLLSLRNADKKPDSPSQALMDYFSAQKSGWDEFETLKQNVDNLESENHELNQEIQQLLKQIEQAKQDKLRKQEEERIRLEEEAKKNVKKVSIFSLNIIKQKYQYYI
ncbi:hypothetical protein pb186bvf_012786 [Paramecium bursaria]